MATTRITGSTGSVAYGSSTAGNVYLDFDSHTLTANQVVDESIAFGDTNGDTVAGAGHSADIRHYGAGAIKWTANVTGFAKYDDTAQSPHLEGLCSSAGTVPGALTLLYVTGCSYAFVPVFASVTLNQSRTRGVVLGNFTAHNAGLVTAAWDETP